jgi:hypothetical protein
MNFFCSDVLRRLESPVARHAATALCVAMAMGCALPCRADDAPAVKLSEAEQAKADELDKTTLLAKKEADAIAAQAAVAKAKVAAATPATSADVTAPSGAVSGANGMTFAMYMLSLDGLRHVAQKICNDLHEKQVTEVYTSSKDVAEAVAKDEAFSRARSQLEAKLTTAKTQAERMTGVITGANPADKISAASLMAIASGIDIATGLVKGAAGLASLFKSERKIEGSDNLLTATEVSASLSMCVDNATAKPQTFAAPRIKNVDNDLKNLTTRIGQIGNEVKLIADAAAALDAALTDLATASAALDKLHAEATEKKDKERLAQLDKRAAPVNLAAFNTKAAALVTQAQAYVDSVYQVDANSGLSPLIVAAQFRALREAAMSAGSKRLVLSLLKSSGYTLTTKRLFLNDRVDYAGGVAVRASVLDETGSGVYDRIFFRESGWVHADFKSSGQTIGRQNF